MANLSRLYYGTRTKTDVQSNTINHEHAFGFETATDQNGFFTVDYGENPPGAERVTSKSANGYTVTPRTGSYMASTLQPPAGQIAGVAVTLTIPEGAVNAALEFWVYVHDEINDEISSNGWYALYDRLRIRLNNADYWHFYWADQNGDRAELSTNWDPENPPYVLAGAAAWNDGHAIAWGKWMKLRIPLQPGTHFLEFEHFADSGDGAGNIYGTRSMYLDDLRVTYTTAAGEVITTPGQPLVYFDGSDGYQAEHRWEGAIMPPVQHAEYSLPFQPGSVHEYTSIEARDFVLALWVLCEAGECMRDKLRWLASKLALQDGALFAELDNGTMRELPCRLTEMEQAENVSTKGVAELYFKTLLTFRAFDPFWYGPLEAFETTAGSNGTYLHNQGDFETWPIYRIKGPIINPEILLKHPDNLSDTAYIKKTRLNYTVTAGRIITIDTRPGYKSITLDDGTNLYSTLDGNFDPMFPIPPGEWYLDLDGGGYDGTEKLMIHWREAYWGM